jgi:hypothetical protein
MVMNNITLAQREALDVVKDMIDRSNTSIPDYGTKIMTLILGILNVDCRVEHTITQIDDDKTTPITPDNGTNDKLQQGIEIPDWIKTKPFPPFVPGDKSSEPAPWEPRVWYNHESGITPANANTNAQEDVRYATEVSCTGHQNCITITRNPNDITYTGNTGDFRDEREQSTFKDK